MPSYRLYKEENILVLRFLRNADGIDDINASTTQQEYIDKYIAKKYGYLEKKQNIKMTIKMNHVKTI